MNSYNEEINYEKILKKEEKFYNNINNIWKNVFNPYISKNNNILNMIDCKDFNKFKLFCENNLKDYDDILKS
tara:strand:+ start:219 stop:434 length:216 start_codon:yes stop_codon:yes gene_type:complete